METTVPAVEKVERKPGQWGETALGLLPFLVIGLATLLMAAPASAAGMQVLMVMNSIFFLGGYLVILYGLFRGWLLGFPRWVYPYLVCGIVFAYFFSTSATPGLAIFGVPLFGRDLWGWRAFVPLGIVAVLALVCSRPPWGNLVHFVKGIWNDWTRLSFGLYGLMMTATMVLMDEVERSFRFPPTLLAVVLVILGALGYMRLGKTWQRMAALLVCAGVSLVILLAAMDYFWRTHFMNFATGEVRVLDVAVDPWSLISQAARITGPALLILLLPLPVGVLHWLWQRFRPAELVGK